MTSPVLPISSLTPEMVRHWLAYDPETGLITWRIPTLSGKKAGDPAGSLRPEGYMHIRVCGCQPMAHRVAWLLYYGDWPDGNLDHIDGIRSNNAISNLRLVSRSQNQKNKARCRRNKSGCVGVRWDKTLDAWLASITSEGKQIYLLSTRSLIDAAAARKSAEIKYNFHPTHGRVQHEQYARK